MTLFESLFLAHLLGDWILQTEYQAQNKARVWRAMLAHIIIYHVVVFAVLVLRFGARDPRIWVATGVLALLHAIIDRRVPVIRLMQTLRATVNREPQFWLLLAVDQSIHLLLLGAVALWLG